MVYKLFVFMLNCKPLALPSQWRLICPTPRMFTSFQEVKIGQSFVKVISEHPAFTRIKTPLGILGEVWPGKIAVKRSCTVRTDKSANVILTVTIRFHRETKNRGAEISKRFRVAHLHEQGVDMIVVPLDDDFGALVPQ